MLMRSSKFKLIPGIGVAAMLLCSTAAAASDATSPGALSASQIFEKVRENYASLFSYSDEGQIITTMDGTVIVTEFTTVLARPNFYRLEWDQYSNPPLSTDNAGIQGAWSSGAGDYMQTGWGLRRRPGRDVDFANVADSSSSALVTVPGIFFDGRGSGKLLNLERRVDDKAGNVECYQLTGESKSGETNAFWIGKRDFLIHQIRTDVSSEVMRRALGGLTRQSWEPMNDFHGFSSIETLTNIVVNKQFSHADFVPSFPLFTRSVYP